MGDRALEVFKTQAGATERSIAALRTLLFKVSAKSATKYV
jgi:hypothetical protein